MPDNSTTVYVTARLLPGWYSDGSGGGAASSGYRQRDGIYDNDFLDDRPPASDGSGSGESQPESGPPPISIESLPPTQIGRTAYDRFKAVVAEIHSKMGGVLGPRTLTTNDGKSILLSEIYSEWLRLVFVITTTTDYPPGYGGGTTRSDQYGHVSALDLNNSIINKYALQAGEGLYWLALHELSHTITATSDFMDQQYQTYLVRGGIASDWGVNVPEFIAVEKYTNNIERQIAQIIGVPTLINPPGGE